LGSDAVPATLEPVEEGELAEFISGQLSSYVDERVGAGEPRPEAERIAQVQITALFPGGHPAVGQLVFRILDEGGDRIGLLWIGPHSPNRPESFWVWSVEIDAEYRGRGFGRMAMRLAEETARAHGATELGLNVFGPNLVARSLYESMGYEPTAINMRKSLV
jgi:ribosomal protein S18 acetylase RimI-like enzyme